MDVGRTVLSGEGGKKQAVRSRNRRQRTENASSSSRRVEEGETVLGEEEAGWAALTHARLGLALLWQSGNGVISYVLSCVLSFVKNFWAERKRLHCDGI